MQVTYPTPLPVRAIGDLHISAVSMGCMNISHAYSAPLSDAQGERVLLSALDAGMTMFDTATLYGFGANETLVGKALAKHRSRFMLASKCGMGGEDVNGDGKLIRVIDGSPANIKRQCELSLKRLQTDVIDLYYLHRWDKKVPIEDSVGALADLVAAGKIRHIGLSEVSAATLRRAHAVAPVAALQTEYSLWTRNPEIATLQTCQELGTAFVAFSPVGRGFLADNTTVATSYSPSDVRHTMPRFLPDNYAKNLALLAQFKAIALSLGHTPAQLALAWVLHQGPHIVAIPGTTQVAHVQDNAQAAHISLDAHTLAQLNALINQQTVAGGRYTAQAESEVDTETFSE
ncbi:aldo/keto reductase [Comamonadaceae bacterium M7527]|nr:aldo/keto reductase [Comamonadaceae bacterium M7527]